MPRDPKEFVDGSVIEGMSHPAASCGVSEGRPENSFTGVTPEVFIGGLFPDSPGFPLKTCGNDGFRKENWFNAASRTESTHRD
jgi:hypothetical protein